MAILAATNILKTYYGRSKSVYIKALNGINLEVNKDEFLGIMGASGSGKTTLMNILSGIDKATGGKVEISGEDIFKMKDYELALFRRQKLGCIFQEFNLLDSLTVKDNIILPMVLDKKYKDEIEKRLNEIAEIFNIIDILQKYPYTISGGQQQRVAICRAIVNKPEIIFADEPTGNLDSKSSRVVMESFQKLRKSNKSTIIMVTHDAFTASYCDRIVFIKDGIINEQISRKDGRKAFFNNIIEVLASYGGDIIDI